LKDFHGLLVEFNSAPAGAGLDAELDGSTADALHGAHDRQSSTGAVEVAPSEADDLTAPHPGVGGKVQRRIQPLRCCGGEEPGEFVESP
jgi:hypothetical protein